MDGSVAETLLTDQAGDFSIIANARDVAVTRPSGKRRLKMIILLLNPALSNGRATATKSHPIEPL